MINLAGFNRPTSKGNEGTRKAGKEKGRIRKGNEGSSEGGGRERGGEERGGKEKTAPIGFCLALSLTVSCISKENVDNFDATLFQSICVLLIYQYKKA